MVMLLKKMLREYKRNWVQFLAVGLMSFICLLVFSGVNQLGEQMKATAKEFSDESRLASAVLTVTDWDNEQLTRLKNLDAVTKIQARKSAVIQAEEQQFTALSFSENYLNKPFVLTGDALSDRMGVWLDQEFMNANHLKTGDSLVLGQKSWKILGSVKQPEFVYYTSSADQPLPNPKKNGYFFIHENYFDALNTFPAQQLLLELNTTKNDTWLKKKLKAIFQNDLLQVSFKKDYAGLRVLNERATQIKRIALLFSSLFVLLVLITMEATMSRFITQQQLVIGSLKALGLTKGEILRHYLAYGFLTAFLGSLSGLLVGPRFLTPQLLRVAGQQFSVPNWAAVQTPTAIYLAVVLTLLCVGITIFPIRTLLQKNPANILHKETLTGNGAIPFENSRFWKLLPFSFQWTLRDIRRNLKRGLLGIFGALGCTILLLTAFGIYDSIQYSLEDVFSRTYHYDSQAALTQGAAANQRKEIEQRTAEPIQWMQQASLKLLTNYQEENIHTVILSAGDGIAFSNPNGTFTELNQLTENQGMISEALAQRFGIKKGDTIWLNNQNQTVPVFIEKLTINSAPQGIFLNQKVWEANFGPFLPASLLLKKADSSKELVEHPLIQSVTTNTQQYKDSQVLLTEILSIVLLIMLAALVLGITIMLNCHLLIFSERFIEFATLKVLGFTQSELFRLSFLENFSLTLIGWLLGLPLGFRFLSFYVQMVSTENQRYLPHVSMQSYILVTLILISCMLLVQLIIQRKIRHIDFSTALKPAE